jgi:hypothetical protein
VTTLSRGWHPTLALLLVASLTACGGSEAEPGDAPPAAAPSSSAPTPSPSATPDEPEVTPASGPRVRTEAFTMNAPQGWRVTSPDLPFVDLERAATGASVPRDPAGQISVIALPSGRRLTLEQEARGADAEGRRLADTEIDGEAAYHFRLREQDYLRDTYGLWRDDFTSVTVAIAVFGGTGREREALAESVLASWEWQG